MSADLTPCPYGICDGSGFVIDDATNTARDCRCRPQRIAAARARSLEARIPRKYRDVAFDRFPVTEIDPTVVDVVRRFCHDIEANLDAGRGIWLEGDPGTGKTTLAMLVSKAAIEARRTTAIYSLPRLMGVLRESIESEEGLLGLLDRLATVDLLHIDDLGAEHRTDWVNEQLYSIVNTRYEDQRSIVLTTNATADELEQQIGARTVSRLVEMCGDPLALFGADRRRELDPTL
ncbi:MAG: ATP-binding protein [Solirubrobacteraceae bacterium]|nr:ATP-binding protein [Solirubrobacteraceae bacterium]